MRLTLTEAFDVLGVSKDASSEQVRQAYRQLALRFHPDKNSGADATATFQRVSAAYKRICDHREQQQKRGHASSGSRPASSPFFFDVSDEELEDSELGFDDSDADISLEEMLLMFQMMFGMSSGSRQGRGGSAASGSKSHATTNTGRVPRPKSSQAASSGKAPGVTVNIGGRRRRAKGKRQPKNSYGSRGFDQDMADIEDEMARMFMADPLAFHVDELDSDEDAEFMDMARLLAMGGRPAMRGLFGAGGARQSGRGGASSKSARKGASQQSDQPPSSHEVLKPRAPTQDAEANQSSCPNQDRSALAVGANVQVYGRLPGVVKFVGQVHYAKGEFVGVELLDAAGKNSGTVKGVNYFACVPGHGLMVRPTDVACAPNA